MSKQELFQQCCHSIACLNELIKEIEALNNNSLSKNLYFSYNGILITIFLMLNIDNALDKNQITDEILTFSLNDYLERSLEIYKKFGSE